MFRFNLPSGGTVVSSWGWHGQTYKRRLCSCHRPAHHQPAAASYLSEGIDVAALAEKSASLLASFRSRRRSRRLIKRIASLGIYALLRRWPVRTQDAPREEEIGSREERFADSSIRDVWSLISS